MEMTTRYNVDDVIYFMNGAIPAKAAIGGIECFTGVKTLPSGEIHSTGKDEFRTLYYTSEGDCVHEKNAYASKEEMINELFKKL